MVETIQDVHLHDAVLQLDTWLDSVRTPVGYGGPVAHWWRQSLLYTGPGLDWRYEGIIAGYLNLWKKTGDLSWLDKAKRAGDDLLTGQLADGHFYASAFEINPASGGTPHEAACDLGLLMLSQALRDAEIPSWKSYFDCAVKNLQSFYLDQLWDEGVKSFRDTPDIPSFVPNKAATACEAFFLLTELAQEARWVEQYVLPTLDRMITHQVWTGCRLDGGICQNSFGKKQVEKYFPFYIGRCIPALVRGYEWSGQNKYLDSAVGAGSFIKRWCCPDGSFPQVIYPSERLNRYPQWIAGTGDILRALKMLEPYGFEFNLEETITWLLQGQESTGGIRTAIGFASQFHQRPPGDPPEFRDMLPVAGWCDKAFRFFTEMLPEQVKLKKTKRSKVKDYEARCTYKGEQMLYRETGANITLLQDQERVYYWEKGRDWATADRLFWTV